MQGVRQAGRQAGRQPDRQTDRQTDREIKIGSNLSKLLVKVIDDERIRSISFPNSTVFEPSIPGLLL